MAATRVRFYALLLPALRYMLVIMFLIALPAASPAQLVLGQYEDEAPLRSWNTFGLTVAASLGRGETQFALAEDCSAALTNPALLPSLPKFSVCLNGSYSYTSLYRYSIVNTGVLSTEKNPAIGLYTLDFGGISFIYKGWAVALTAALIESYDRPGVSARSYFQGIPYYEISFGQTGYLRNFNLAVARAFGRAVQAGIGFNLVRGDLHREVIDRDFSEDITIRHLVDQKFSGFYLNAGVLARLTERLDLACVFRTPYDKKAEGQSRLRYQAPRGGTDILIEAAADDRYRQPWAAGLGVRYGVSENFRIVGDLAYFLWSQYRAEFFGENERRDFRNTFKAGAGGEYSLRIRLFGHDAAIPLRLGISYDKLPMRIPDSAYTNLTAGAGVRWRMIVFDIGGLSGRESGSGHSLKILRIASSLGIRL
ncbi:MAG: outer membrane protein transport protein [Candidatus Aminicenantales bacterium]